MHEALIAAVGIDAPTIAIGAVTSMLGLLFGAFIKAMADAANRSDASAEARVEAKDAEILRALIERNQWRDLYLQEIEDRSHE